MDAPGSAELVDGQMCIQLTGFRGEEAPQDRERTRSGATFLPPFRDEGDPAALMVRGSGEGGGTVCSSFLTSYPCRVQLQSDPG